MTVEDLVSSMLRDEGGFQKALRNILDEELNMSLNEFCQISGISQSTVYKILEERREPNLRTVRQIVRALKQIYGKGNEKFLAVIASSTFMEGLPKSLDTSANGTVGIREYTVSTVEDAIISDNEVVSAVGRIIERQSSNVSDKDIYREVCNHLS